jgi:hypothetical protein
MPTKNGRSDFKVAYTVVERGGKKLWLRIGTAFTNRDASINLYLDAFPANGMVQIRELNASSERIADLPAQREEPAEKTG